MISGTGWGGSAFEWMTEHPQYLLESRCAQAGVVLSKDRLLPVLVLCGATRKNGFALGLDFIAHSLGHEQEGDGRKESVMAANMKAHISGPSLRGFGFSHFFL